MPPIDTLRAALQADDPGSLCEPPRATTGSEYAVWRFLTAWRHARDQRQPLGPDHAVLLRQVARWHPSEPHVGSIPPSFAPLLARAGLELSAIGTLRATPFAPSWLTAERLDPSRGIDAAPERRRLPEAVPGEAYLATLGFDDWHSQAQKEAVWTALTAAPRSSTLVALPTGAGKSLCVQVAVRFSDGLTVVVVPTVALAIDQWHSAVKVFAQFDGVNPDYFAADDPERDPAAVIDRVRRRECRLLFTSPESCVSGRFRDLLASCAADGWLENLVIDEAHLVDTWGVFFRVDFQLLAALRRQWLAHDRARVRTLLLSATFTPECRAVLRRLFCEEGTPWRELLSQRLRPEMTYYVQRLRDEEARTAAVVEAAWHLPRPAIIYTTTRADAMALTARLRADGFERLACFHGDTPGGERRRLLAAWRQNKIDLMVATAAFGVGVDKQDVRAVVHACLPEDLHRYYQEVGRGGRDGHSAVCLLLATDADEGVARRLAPRLLLPETLQERWTALWSTATPLSDEKLTYRLRLDAKPTNLRGTRTGGRHVAWNKRLLLQLVRAGKLDIVDVRLGAASDAAPSTRLGQVEQPASAASVAPRAEDEGTSETAPSDALDAATEAVEAEYLDPVPELPALGAGGMVEWAVVRLRFTPNTAVLGALIEEVRDREIGTLKRGLDLILRYLDGAHCVGHALTDLYGASTARACGGCPACRRRGRHLPCPPLAVPASMDTSADQIVVADVPNLRAAALQRAFITLVRRVMRERGVRRFVCDAATAPLLRTLLRMAVDPTQPIAYRVDVLDSAVPFLIDPSEAVAVLHVGRLLDAALQVRRGRVMYHLITSDTTYLDQNERRPLESAGARFYPTPELWLQDTLCVHS